MKCLCGEELELRPYSGGECEKCGREWEYEEMMFPVLTEKEKEYLKEVHND